MSNDPFSIYTNNSILIPLLNNDNDGENIFSNLFNVLFDNIIENDRFNEAIQNSMETFNKELFKKIDEYEIDKSAIKYIDSVHKCFICLEINDENIIELPCSHKFHYDCINTSVLHQHYKCPLCHSDIPRKTILKEENINNAGHIISYLN
jgi:SUMO ligase MMS21 Smc5/6 complex component